MSLYFKTLRFLAPDRAPLTLTLLVSFLASLFSVVSITTIFPLLDAVFNPTPAHDTTGVRPESPPLSLTESETLKDRFLESFRDLMQGFGREETLLLICLFLIGIFIIKNLFLYLSNHMIYRLESKATKKLRDAVFGKIIGMEPAFFQENRVGNLMNYVNNEVRHVCETVGSSFIIISRNITLALSYILLLLVISWKLTFFALCVSLFSLVLIRVLGRSIQKQAGVMQERMGDINSHLQEVFNGIKVVQAYVKEDYEKERFGGFTDLYRRANVKISVLRGMIGPLNETLGVSAIALVLWYGGLQVFSGEMKSIELIVFAFALFSTMGPIKSVAESISRAQEGFPSARRLFEILEAPSLLKNGSRTLVSFRQCITFEDVWFRYPSSPEGEYVLKAINVEIPYGKSIALVGQSGSGKSTIVDLLLRFYDPQKGRILIDGVDIREYETSSLRRHIGVVSQEIVLFNDTIAQNIAYGAEAPPLPSAVEHAARLSNAHDFIANDTPNAYHTKIGDRGTRLSGGQRQRLSIARAMLKNPSILIFDEATSALDNASEQKVQYAIDNAMTDRTSIVIAHRLSTIKHANMIYLLEKGEIKERGTHQELIDAKCGYYSLYMMQFSESHNSNPNIRNELT